MFIGCFCLSHFDLVVVLNFSDLLLKLFAASAPLIELKLVNNFLLLELFQGDLLLSLLMNLDFVLLNSILSLLLNPLQLLLLLVLSFVDLLFSCLFGVEYFVSQLKHLLH